MVYSGGSRVVVNLFIYRTVIIAIGLVISLRIPSSSSSSTHSDEAEDASKSDSGGSSSSSSADVAVENGKEGDVSVPLRCASDGDASDSRCARPFHIHCSVTSLDKIPTDTDS